MPVIYIDVVFIINFFIDFALVYACSRLSKTRIRLTKALLSALFGAVYAVLVYVPFFAVFNVLIFKIIASVIIILIAFNIRSIRELIIQMINFYFLSFLLGGVCLGAGYFTENTKANLYLPKNIMLSPSLFVVFGALIAALLLKTILSLYKINSATDSAMADVTVVYNNKSVVVPSIIDTGNCLTEPISGNPCMIAELSALSPVLPKDLYDLLLSCDAFEIPYEEEKYLADLCFIPYSSLGTEKDILLGIKPDEIIIENKVIKDVVIAIYKNKLSQNRMFSGIISPLIYKVNGGKSYVVEKNQN